MLHLTIDATPRAETAARHQHVDREWGNARVVEQRDVSALVAEHYHAHERVVLGLLYSLVGSIHDAQDLTQDVFVELHEALQAGDDIRNARTWLLNCAHRRAVDSHRMRQTRHRFAAAVEALHRRVTGRADQDDAADEGPSANEPSLIARLTPPGAPPTPDDYLRDQISRDLLKRALLKMKPLTRACVILRWRGLTYQEIRDSLGFRSKDQVRWRLARAVDLVERTFRRG